MSYIHTYIHTYIHIYIYIYINIYIYIYIYIYIFIFIYIYETNELKTEYCKCGTFKCDVCGEEMSKPNKSRHMKLREWNER